MKVESKNLDSTESIPVIDGKLQLTKIKDLTGSAPELEPSSAVVKVGESVKFAGNEVKSTDKQLTNSSNSLKPMTRG